VTILHLSRLELYRMNPGLFYDMVQMHKDMLPKGKADDFEQ